MEQNKRKDVMISLDAAELSRIERRAIRWAQEENRRLGIPNAYSRNGVLYFELPDGTITQEDPFVEDAE